MRDDDGSPLLIAAMVCGNKSSRDNVNEEGQGSNPDFWSSAGTAVQLPASERP